MVHPDAILGRNRSSNIYRGCLDRLVDGWLARRWEQESAFGAFLDPVADKLMVAAALVLLVDAFDSSLVTLSAIVIIGREIVVSALREWMSEIGQRTQVAVSWLGKVKTASQMLAITACLALPIELKPTHPGLGCWSSLHF